MSNFSTAYVALPAKQMACVRFYLTAITNW